MERLKNDTPTNRRPARSRRHASCVRSQGRRHDPDQHTSEERIDQRQRLERMIDRKVAEKLRARSRRHGLEIGRLQRQVERRGGTMRIVIEFPAQPARPQSRRHDHPRRPRFV